MKDFENWFEEDWFHFAYSDGELNVLAKKLSVEDKELIGEWALDKLWAINDSYGVLCGFALACLDEKRVALKIWGQIKAEVEEGKKREEEREKERERFENDLEYRKKVLDGQPGLVGVSGKTSTVYIK